MEPPGLFRGRGEHPKMGRIKRRIYPKDITINIGKGVPIPEHPYPDQHWKEVRRKFLNSIPELTSPDETNCTQATQACATSLAFGAMVVSPQLSTVDATMLEKTRCGSPTLSVVSACADPARQHGDVAGVLARSHQPDQLQVCVAGSQQRLQVRERPGQVREGPQAQVLHQGHQVHNLHVVAVADICLQCWERASWVLL